MAVQVPRLCPRRLVAVIAHVGAHGAKDVGHIRQPVKFTDADVGVVELGNGIFRDMVLTNFLEALVGLEGHTRVNVRTCL